MVIKLPVNELPFGIMFSMTNSESNTLEIATENEKILEK